MLDLGQHEAAVARADAVLDLARRSEVTPTPEVFAVLSEFLEGNDTVLSAEVEAALSRQPEQRTRALINLYFKRQSADKLQAELDRMRTDLIGAITSAAGLIDNSIRGTHGLARDLRKSLRDMAGVVTREDLQIIARHLAVASRSHLSDTQSTSEQMERTREQLVTMERELEDLRQAVWKDYLTGLANRRYLDDRLEALVQNRVPLCLALIDLDNFKRVNDEWGHAAGDNILRGLARTIQRNIKGKDFAARLGGEEFVLVLPETALEGGAALCNSIREEFSQIVWVSQASEEEIGQLTLSAGISVLRSDDDPGALIARADAYMYKAKKSGRNQVIAGA